MALVLDLISDAFVVLAPVTMNFESLSNSRIAPEPRYSFLSHVTTPFVPVVSTVSFPFATICP